MTNDTFNWPEGGEWEWRAFDSYYIIPNEVYKGYYNIADREGAFDILLNDIQIGLFYFAQRDAQIKAQRWLSPEDQKPFCKEAE
jgi:hypothetical protein